MRARPRVHAALARRARAARRTRSAAYCAKRIAAERDQPPFDRVTMDGIAIAGKAWLAGGRRFRVAGTQGAGAAALRLARRGRVRRGHDRQRAADRGRHHHSGGARHAARGDRSQRRSRLRRERRAVHSPARLRSRARRGAARPGRAPSARAEAAILTDRRPRRRRHHPLAAHRRGLHRRRARGRRRAHRGVPDPLLQRPRHRGGAAAGAASRRSTRATLRDDPQVLQAGDRPAARGLGPADPLRRRVDGTVRPRAEDAGGSRRRRSCFTRSAQRPGMPMWFGRDAAGKVVFALPGNPVSSLVCLVRYVVPGLAAAMGAAPRPMPRVRLGVGRGVQARPHLFPAGDARLERQWRGQRPSRNRPTRPATSSRSAAPTASSSCRAARTTSRRDYAAKFFDW